LRSHNNTRVLVKSYANQNKNKDQIVGTNISFASKMIYSNSF